MKLKMKPIKLFILLALSLIIAGVANQSFAEDQAAKAPAKTLYTCGMHPWVIQDHPGNCSICGMKLNPIRKEAGAGESGVPAKSGERKIEYYKSTMMPGETSPKPGKDSMGMDMVPVYTDEAVAVSSSVINVDPATIQLMNIQTAEITRGPLRRTIRTVGVIDYNETTLADVTTKFKGWIEKLTVNATGELVHRSDPLFEIYSPELYSAQVEYLLATDPTKPVNDSLKQAGLTKLKYFDISDAQIAELDRRRQPQKTLRILAPEDGFVIEKDVVEGQMVDAGMKIYRLADLGVVWIYAQIYEQDLPYVKLGQEAVVRTASMPDREFRGRVTYVYPNVDEKTRTARVRLEFENPGYFLKPGMFVSATIVSELEPSALLVPDSAVLRSGEKNTVFIALPGGKFDPHTVGLGPEAENDNYEVISGLAEGERVVISGQFMLDSESQLREAIQKMREPSSGAMETPAITNTNVNKTQPVSSAKVEKEGVVYVCPMPEHVSIVYDHPGQCPICGMTFVPVTPGELKQLQPGGKIRYYTCPMPEHASVHEDKPGKCPICGMTLIPVMEAPPLPAPNANSILIPSTLYTCPMPAPADVVSAQPGKCPKCGMELVPTSTVAHGKIAEENWRKQHPAGNPTMPEGMVMPEQQH